MGISTVKELVSSYNQSHPDSPFFSRENMKFFGETFSTMRLQRETETVTDERGQEHECYVLLCLQRNHPVRPVTTPAYFDIHTLDVVYKN